jgi:dynein heavy chain 2
VAQKDLEDVAPQIGKNFEAIVNSILSVHSTASKLGGSPMAYTNLIQTFKQILTKILQSSGGQSKHLMAGLEKLQEAHTLVDELSRQANQQKILLNQKQAEAKAALGEITKSMEAKAERKQEVEALQAKVAEDQKMIQQRKAQVEHELLHVQPEVDAAKAAVGDLKPANLNEIKAFRMPPEAVSDVLQGVLRLMRQEDTSWNAMKRFLSQSGVIPSILNFDASTVTNKVREKVNKLIESRPGSFDHLQSNCSSGSLGQGQRQVLRGAPQD